MSDLVVNLEDKEFGWGWSTTPTGEDAYSIETPRFPDWEGTVKQVREASQSDVVFHSLGGAFYNTAWFYDGRRITHTWSYDCIADHNDPNAEEYDWDKREYGYAWIPGFDVGVSERGKMKIRVED